MFSANILYELQEMYHKLMTPYVSVVNMINTAPPSTRKNILLIIRRAKTICELYDLDQEHIIYILVNGGNF